MEKNFAQVFPTCKLNKVLDTLFSDVTVERVSTNKQKDFLRIYLRSDHLLPKQAVYDVEKELKNAELKQLSDKGQLTLDSIRSTSTQFKETMSRIDSAVDALTELIQMLDNDPSALVRGKKNPASNKK